jgi:ribonuclease HI
MNNETIVFTDGSSRGNPGPGGWGAVIKEGSKIIELGGREDNTTNNKMELTAIIEALKKITLDERIIIHTDSTYAVKGIREWIHGWEKNNWITSTKQPVLNVDLWKELKKQTDGRSIFWKIIPGHSGIPANERCDVIATLFADNSPTPLFSGELKDYSVTLEVPDVLPKKKPTNKGTPYAYVSMVDNKIETHKTWKECETRVKGTKSLYKKVFSEKEMLELKDKWLK